MSRRSARPAGRAAILVMSRHAASESAANRPVESGNAPKTTSGPRKQAVSPEPIARFLARAVGSPISAAASAPKRQASAAIAPPETTDTTCAARNQLAAPASQIGIAARRLGSGSHTSNAARGTTRGCV